MPFKSEAQRRLFHVKANKGEISKETVSEWEHATKNKKKLPMHVKKASDYDRGAFAALALFSKEADVRAPMVNPAPVVGSAATQAAAQIHPLASTLANSLVGGATGGLINAAMAPKGDRLRQGLIGLTSDSVGAALGPWGMLASPAINMALQHFTSPKEDEKRADHADDRLKERIKTEFPPDALAKLRAQAKNLELAPGRYYLPMKDKAGNTAAIAAFKTVGPKDQLVLATVLAPKKNPPSGTSLSHLMKQPMGAQVAKVDASPKQYTIRKNPEGRYTCTCKSFKFVHRGAGTNCKHIDAHLGNTKESAEGVRYSGEPIDNQEEPQAAEAAMPPPEKKKSWLPALGTAAAIGLGTYGLLRRPSFSTNPALRKTQQLASTKGFHRVVPLMRTTDQVDPDAGFMGRLNHAIQPKIDEQGRMNLLNRFKFWAQEGGEAIPVGFNPKGKAFIPNGRGPVNTEGVVFGRPMLDPKDRKNIVVGGQDIEGSHKTQRALTDMGLKGKGMEASLMQRYSPGAVPKTVVDLGQFMKGSPGGDRVARIRAIQKAMQEKYKGTEMENFLLKPTLGFNSGGKFPMSEDDWGKHLARFDKAMADPVFKAKFDKATPDQFADMVWDKGILQGHTLHEMLKNPSSAIAQQQIPNRLGEWRVNVTKGEAPLGLMAPRGATDNPLEALKEIGTEGVSPFKIKKFVEEHIKKLPQHYREGTYGADVMPYYTPEGKLDYKFVELNPSERAGYHGSEGGGSGFLDAYNLPWAGHAHYRTATGRHATPVALAGGLAAAGAAGGLARYLTPEQKAQQEEEEAPHPVG